MCCFLYTMYLKVSLSLSFLSENCNRSSDRCLVGYCLCCLRYFLACKQVVVISYFPNSNIDFNPLSLPVLTLCYQFARFYSPLFLLLSILADVSFYFFFFVSSSSRYFIKLAQLLEWFQHQ